MPQSWYKGTDSFTSPPKKGMLMIIQTPEKSNGFGRFRNCEPLDHRSRFLKALVSVPKNVHLLLHVSLSLPVCNSFCLFAFVSTVHIREVFFFLRKCHCGRLRKSVEKPQIFKLGKNVGNFTRRPKYFHIVHCTPNYCVHRQHRKESQLLLSTAAKGCYNAPLCTIYVHCSSCYIVSTSLNKVYLTLYVPCIIFQCVDNPTKCNTSYE